jgi:hypothetical protein
MRTSSAKAKGRKLQAYVRNKLLELYPQLTENDIRSVPSGTQGEDIQLSEKAREVIPLSIECKNQEKLAIWAALKQSESENRDLTPLLVFKRNRSEVYCALKFEDFLKIVGEGNGKE